MPADRWIAALVLVLAYAALCGWTVRRHRIQRRRALLPPGPQGAEPWLVLHASQTGQAERIAGHTAQALHAAGEPARILALGDLSVAQLASARRALLVLSTSGEGDAPDSAAGFLDAIAQAAPSLASLRYGILALGDRRYRHFCGFGRSADALLARHGARPLFDRLEADQGDAASLQAWRAHLGRLTASGAAPAGHDDPWQDDDPWQAWTLAARRHLNPGSEGGGIWLVRLRPPAGQASAWESGDLAQVAPPGADGPPRNYSIASIAADGVLDLVVRQTRRADGTAGAASAWLTAGAPMGGPVALRLRPHPGFRLGANRDRPLVLVGNGSGIAGLRGHLRARAAAGRTRNWLVFGERRRAVDFLLQEEIDAWRRDGLLQRVDLAFSRDQAPPVYVQHLLASQGDALERWMADGAAVYVCGSREGMARGVDIALRDVLGAAAVDRLAAEGRYRRDVY